MTAETLLPSMTLPTGQAPSAQSFADLGVDPRAVATLARMSIETPTLIQARAIPPLLAGRDVIGQSRTGSGKTIAYGLPLVERMDPRLRRVQALVLVPTRELAGQVASVLLSLGANRGLRVAQLIGGRSYLPQREALRMGAQIAVGAPGRVLDHLRQGTLDLSNLTFAVLDEADQMLDAGFAPDVERLLAAMPEGRQLALFTATLPEMTTQIANRHLHEPVSVDAGEPESRPASSVTQVAYTVPREHRLHALMTLLDRRRHASGTTLVFGRTKHGVDKLARQLIARGYPVAALHGNMSQNARDRVLTDFRSGKAPMLLATNVAARGLDVLSIEQVINYELPESAELFTHRVGRTGRMDNTGEAITLLTPDDMAAWRRFQRDLAMRVKPQPWPLDETLAAAAASSAPTQSTQTASSDAPAVVATPTLAEPEQTERRPERRSDRSTERFGERRPARRGMNGERRFEREFERGQEVGERGQARRPFTEEERPTRRADVAARWSRPATESERQDDYREYRERRSEGARSDRREDTRREDTRRERRDETRFEGRRDDTRRDNARFEGRRDDYRERRFSGERDIRRDDARFEGRRDDRRGSARDERRDETRRPASPRRATGGFRAAEGGAPRRPARARGFRSARG